MDYGPQSERVTKSGGDDDNGEVYARRRRGLTSGFR